MLMKTESIPLRTQLLSEFPRAPNTTLDLFPAFPLSQLRGSAGLQAPTGICSDELVTCQLLNLTLGKQQFSNET